MTLTIQDGQLYLDGELVMRGEDESAQVEEPRFAAISYFGEASSDGEVWPISTTNGIVAYATSEAGACLIAQLLEFGRLHIPGWNL